MKSMVLTLSKSSEDALDLARKIGVANDIDVSNKVKQANLSIELFGKMIKKLSTGEIEKLLKN